MTPGRPRSAGSRIRLKRLGQQTIVGCASGDRVPRMVLLLAMLLVAGCCWTAAWAQPPGAAAATSDPAAAAAPFAGSEELLRTFEWGRIQSRADWLAPLAGLAALAALARWIYRREERELPRGLGWLLTLLRVATWGTLLVVYLEPQWRTAREITTQSRVVVLVDSSLSMALADGVSPSTPAGPSRSAQVASALTQSDFLARLREKHDVNLARFDEETERLASLRREKLNPAGSAGPPSPEQAQTDWASLLAPRGTQTRLGEALLETLDEQRGAPLAGIVVLTDGAQNAGASTATAAAAAAAAEVPVFAIGLGSPDRPRNVRVRELAAPTRAAPGDDFQITALIDGGGWAGQTVAVELSSQPSGEAASGEATGASRPEGAQSVTLPEGDAPLPVSFTVAPAEPGTRTYRLRVAAPAGDANPQDDQQQVDVEIVGQPTQVLLIAGGPTREYQFVRNLLHRDSQLAVDVWLQTAEAGVSQDARQILTEFPTTQEALWAYDAILAFDPDWRMLRPGQAEWLERWVSEQAGGLLVVAGRVATDRWTAEPALDPIRRMYPVEFTRRVAMLSDEGQGADRPHPVELTREGREAPLLRLVDDPEESLSAWTLFPGIYDCYEASGVKPGATVYARLGGGGQGEGAPWVVGQFYGAGRVVYLGSGELWRLRRLSEEFYERTETQLVRYLAQGRRLRGSTHGVLLVERDRYTLGETAVAIAQLKNAQLEPLAAEQVVATLAGPDGSLAELSLRPVPLHSGTFRGQWPLRQEGVYRLELVVPESQGQRLVRRVTAEVPDLERLHPERRDAELEALAAATGGRYYRGLGPALGLSGGEPLVDGLADRSKTYLLTGAPIPLWDSVWTLAAACSFLSLEWLLRRLAKLA